MGWPPHKLTDHMKCLTCDYPCLLLELTGCNRADCPHLSETIHNGEPISGAPTRIGPH